MFNDKQKAIEELAQQFYKRLKSCDICPRNCLVNRAKNKIGYCQSPQELKIYTALLHQGEEPPITGTLGSGAIFFSGCNLRCCYCQNFQFSTELQGVIVTETQLAAVMLNLQTAGSHNINLVTPTHYLPQILTALTIAYEQGLRVPIVYNTSGYEKPEIIRQLSGIVDIYLTDIRYFDQSLSKIYSAADDYPQISQAAAESMYQQHPTAVFRDNIMMSGLIIRHLVLPGQQQQAINILRWIQQNMPQALVSLMFQYRPYSRASNYPEINRTINQEEYTIIMNELQALNLNGWAQELIPQDNLAGVYLNSELEKYL